MKKVTIILLVLASICAVFAEELEVEQEAGFFIQVRSTTVAPQFRICGGIRAAELNAYGGSEDLLPSSGGTAPNVIATGKSPAKDTITIYVRVEQENRAKKVVNNLKLSVEATALKLDGTSTEHCTGLPQVNNVLPGKASHRNDTYTIDVNGDSYADYSVSVSTDPTETTDQKVTFIINYSGQPVAPILPSVGAVWVGTLSYTWSPRNTLYMPGVYSAKIILTYTGN